MKSIKQLTDSELDEIISGSVDGVYPTSQEVSMATELKACRTAMLNPEYQAERIVMKLDEHGVPKTKGGEDLSLWGRIVAYRHMKTPSMPAGLHTDTKKLVADFTTAMADKLYKAQLKYGYSDGWKRDDWANECLAHFQQHIAKGDPRDVAAYCAFMWFHGWETELPTPSIPVVPDEVDANDEMFRKLNARECVIAARWWNACRTAMLSTTTGEGHEKPSA